MTILTLSPDFEVELPPSLCAAAGFAPGQPLRALVYDGRIELLPVRSPTSLRGFARGIDTSVPREPDRF